MSDTGITPEPAPSPLMREYTPEERKALLARAVANEVRNGWNVQSQTDFQAIMVKGDRTSHGLHIFLSIVTLGLWLIVWGIMLYVNRVVPQFEIEWHRLDGALRGGGAVYPVRQLTCFASYPMAGGRFYRRPPAGLPPRITPSPRCRHTPQVECCHLRNAGIPGVAQSVERSPVT